MRKISTWNVFRTAVLFLPILIALLGLDAWAAAEEGEHKGGSWLEFLWRVINFVILIAILYWFLAKLIKDFFIKRRESIKEALEAAKKSKEAADRRYKELSDKIAQLEEKAKGIIAELREEGEKEKEKIIRDAGETAKKILEQAEVTASHEIKKAIAGLRQDAANLIVRLAEEAIKKEINAQDQERLIKDYIDKLDNIEGTSV
jgi:F-type H+-transporting ATPase subunit b